MIQVVFLRLDAYNLAICESLKTWPRCSVEKVLLEILHNSQENTRARISFQIKLQA